MTQPLLGRHAIITGASRGFGLAMSQAFVAAGADVMMCARFYDELVQAARGVAARATPTQTVFLRRADVSDPEDVKLLVESAITEFGQVHILVNNAGVYGPIGSLESTNWEAWMQAMQTNLYGSALMMRAVLPHMRQYGYGKIIQVSGGGATQPMPRMTAYAASKAAVVRLAESVAMDVREDGIDVNSLAPGVMDTAMTQTLIQAGPDIVGAACYEKVQQGRAYSNDTMHRATQLAVYLASEYSNGITGKLISAQWDDWESLHQMPDALKTELYTLRRVELRKDRE